MFSSFPIQNMLYYKKEGTIMKVLELNRMNDALFKAVFTNTPGIALSFINAVLNHQGTPTLRELAFIDRELDPVEETGKASRLDLVGKDAITGTKANLEIQVVKQEWFSQRALYYWARLYNDLKKGDIYHALTRTVTINILDFVLFDNTEESSHWHSCFGIYDKATDKQLTTDFEMHFIELPKWRIEKDVAHMDPLERWTSYFDRKTTAKELEAIAMQEPMIREALSAECIFTQDEINRRAYDLKEKADRDYRGQMLYATKQGIQQGIQQGTEQGRTQMKRLVQCLISEGKSADIPIILADDDLVEQLLSKYNIK